MFEKLLISSNAEILYDFENSQTEKECLDVVEFSADVEIETGDD